MLCGCACGLPFGRSKPDKALNDHGPRIVGAPAVAPMALIRLANLVMPSGLSAPHGGLPGGLEREKIFEPNPVTLGGKEGRT